MDEKKTEEELLEAALTDSRRERVSQFSLNVDLDSPDALPEEPVPDRPDSATDESPAPRKKKKKKKGCLGGLLYILIVVLIAVALAIGVLVVFAEITDFGKEADNTVDLTIEKGWYGADIANALKENGIIDYPLIFRAYCKLTHADGTLQPGSFTLHPHMGYDDLIAALQVEEERETVRVTIPEHYTVDQIAALLAEKRVCGKEAFYAELYRWRDYADLPFIAELIAAETADPAVFTGRIYMLEGYLFPDTYEFFTDCSPATVVRKMLENFDKRIVKGLDTNGDRMETNYYTALKARGWTLDDAVIVASIIQREASASIMDKVARVLLNRMENTAQFPKLECCSTRDYINAIMKVPELEGIEITSSAYNTYLRQGLPVGAICNPGIAAFDALLKPSEDPDILKCYFFATDWTRKDQNGEYITYFSKTYAQHEAICKRYKIGAYG